MSYASVDTLQKALANDVFHYAADKKKAAGRALGTLVEIISYYLLQSWQLRSHAAIERPLPEFANKEITHNVEFSLHPKLEHWNLKVDGVKCPITVAKIRRLPEMAQMQERWKNNQILTSDSLIKNACVLAEDDSSILVGHLDSWEDTTAGFEIVRLHPHPFTIFECKRVGVEEGMRKGPQTIEKAKQGAYVAGKVSSLQKVRMPDGRMAGLLIYPDGTCECRPYIDLLREVVDSDSADLLRHFVLTVGVVSNHGNWFTAENQNKELKVLAQSYDWLLFLTDAGLAEFIQELILGTDSSSAPVRDAFAASYQGERGKNRFTKSQIDLNADACLRDYFSHHQKKGGWVVQYHQSKGRHAIGVAFRDSDACKQGLETLYLCMMETLSPITRDFAGRSVNSLSQHWGTPVKYVEAVKEMFGGEIDLDPCSNPYSIVSAMVEYRLPHQDGLRESWNFPRIYVNPPYGADRERGTNIKQWLARCAEAHLSHGSEVQALIPVATNTGHWKKHVWGRARAIAFLYDTRLKFLVNGKDEGKGAPMSCAMVYWGSRYERFAQIFTPHGAVVDLRCLRVNHNNFMDQQGQAMLLKDI